MSRHWPSARYRIGVLWIRLLDVEILLIHAEDGEAPGQAIVVADADPWQARLGGANHVPARRVEVDDVSQGRIDDLAVRVVGDDRFAGRGFAPADHPVVAAEIRLREPGVRREERGRGAVLRRLPRALSRGEIPAQVVGVARHPEDRGVDVRQVEPFRHRERLLRIGRLQFLHFRDAHRLHVERALHFARGIA